MFSPILKYAAASPAAASDLDEAIGKVSGQTVTIPAAAIGSGSEQELSVIATKASVGMDVGFVEETADAAVFQAEATLYAANGRFSGIDEPKLTFAGDFAGAVVKQIERDDAVYRVTFTFSPRFLDLENAVYEGSVSVQNGILLNVWGTPSDNNSADINYVGVANRGETIDGIKAFVAAHKDTLDTISTVGSVVSGVAGAASGIMTVLQICGVVESTDDKLDSIRRQVEDVQASINALSNQLASQTQLINSMVGTAISQNTKILYNTAAGNWNSFIANYQKPLTDALTDYKSAYNQYMLAYINDPTSVEIPVYINENGDVTILGKMDGYDAGGVSLKSSDKYVLNAQLENVKQKVLSNGGRLYEGYAGDIAEALKPKPDEAAFSEFRKAGQAAYDSVLSLGAEEDGCTVSRYNFAVYMAVDRGMSIGGLKSNFSDWFFDASDETWQKAYDILKKGEYCYGDDQKAIVGNSYVLVYKGTGNFPVCTGAASTDITAEQYVNALRLAAAYVNFANALAGTYGSVKLNSTSSPLTFFYDMESYFYNFYSESEYDIRVVRNWMASVLAQGHAIAVLAHTYCTGLDSDYVSKATTAANSEWKGNTGAITVKPGKQYSYIAGDELFTTVVGPVVWLDQNKMAFGNVDYPNWLVGDNYVYNLKASLSISQIEQMKDRYDNIRKKGTASDATFADYLVSKGIISADQKNAWLIGDSVPSMIPKDNSVSVRVGNKLSGDWYDVGDSMKVGTNGKISGKYFQFAYQLKGTAFKLSEFKSDSVTFGARADYSESHWYWRVNENYISSILNPNTLMYIEIGSADAD